MLDVLLVAVGAALGAPSRYLVDRAVMRRVGGAFPWGTLTVNVAGSLLLGAVLGAHWPWATVLVGVGFCGALTTFSTFGLETVRLLDGGARTLATANVAGSVVACVVAGAVGYAATSALA